MTSSSQGKKTVYKDFILFYFFSTRTERFSFVRTLSCLCIISTLGDAHIEWDLQRLTCFGYWSICNWNSSAGLHRVDIQSLHSSFPCFHCLPLFFHVLHNSQTLRNLHAWNWPINRICSVLMIIGTYKFQEHRENNLLWPILNAQERQNMVSTKLMNNPRPSTLQKSVHFALHWPLTPGAAHTPNFWATTQQWRFYMQRKVDKCECLLKKLFEFLTSEH